MITKREKLQYVYVFLTDIAALAASVILAWLIVGGIMGQLLPYSVLDWVQALVLLVLAYTVTFFCFDQTENIVKRTRGQEAKLSIKSNLLMMVIYSAFLTLSKAVLQDSRYFLVGVVSFNLFLLPAAHGLLKKLLVKAPDSLQNETLVGIVTTGDHAGKMIREISNDWSRRVCGVALLEATGDAIGTKVENIEIKANYDTFMNWLRRAALDEVYIDVPMDSGESFIPYLDEKTGKPKMAERSTFDDLIAFFYLDLTRGIAAGNLPRRCKNCGHWFVAVGGYNTQYCDRPILGQHGKTCRSVGAHETAKRKLREAAAKEYARTYNRLKGRKQRGTISTDEWNHIVAVAEELRAAFQAGEMAESEYCRKLKAL